MGKKGPLWWRESDWLLRGSSAANQILLRHSGPILSPIEYELIILCFGGNRKKFRLIEFYVCILNSLDFVLYIRVHDVSGT